MALILNGAGLPTLERCREQYKHGDTHLGRLARPRHIGRLRDTLDAGFQIGIDNDAFSHWNAAAFINKIRLVEQAVWGRVLTHTERTSALTALGLDPASIGLFNSPPAPPLHDNLLWLTVPDVPFDAAATARRFAEWAPLLSHLPLALCVQDGAGDVGIPWPWPGLRCLFMAGSDSYKLSTDMADICREGKQRGLWIHCGRVNSRSRIRYLKALDCVDSIDGTGFDKYRDTHLGWGLTEAAATDVQLLMPFD
jgi:hypothetical protein